jgi:hypothetical protein
MKHKTENKYKTIHLLSNLPKDVSYDILVEKYCKLLESYYNLKRNYEILIQENNNCKNIELINNNFNLPLEDNLNTKSSTKIDIFHKKDTDLTINLTIKGDKIINNTNIKDDNNKIKSDVKLDVKLINIYNKNNYNDTFNYYHQSGLFERLLYLRYTEKLGKTKLARKLNKEGFISRSGGKITEGLIVSIYQLYLNDPLG